MSGSRGSARKGKVKLRIKGKFTNRRGKDKNLYTNIFVSEGASTEEILERLLKKYKGKSITVERAVCRGRNYLIKKVDPTVTPFSRKDQVLNTKNAVYWHNDAIENAKDLLSSYVVGADAFELREALNNLKIV